MWTIRTFNDPPVTIAYDDLSERLYRLNLPHPDIHTVAAWIQRHNPTQRVAPVNALTDQKSTRKYTEYKIGAFPF